jgi:cytoskeletal protein RodZ
MMESSAEILGKELKSKREQLGYSLSDVAEHTRIRKIYLESMEQGHLEALPGQAYVTGFVRVYARHLGLDSDELLNHLNVSDETEQSQSPGSNTEDKATDKQDSERRSGGHWGAFVLGFAGVLALGSLIYFLPISFDSNTTAKSSSDEIVKSARTPELQQTEVVVVTEDVSEASDAQVFLPAITAEGSTLRMLALSESSLIIYLDDHEPREYVLTPGLEQSWDVKTSVRVKLAQPGPAQFWLDGQELKLGELADFTLSHTPGE